GRQIRASEFSLRDAVAVLVGPGDARGRELQRVVAFREPGGPRLLVSADAELGGRLLVAKHVVDKPAAWRNAVPCRHVDWPERARRGEAAGRRRQIGRAHV